MIPACPCYRSMHLVMGQLPENHHYHPAECVCPCHGRKPDDSDLA